ncbi:uncharacterized protein [Nicotiana sylvestris]|uniref:uncharacterized protein n=1 Tax=Nicotiana sylvestris TaxID=4096 RepID=UPI00388CA572
MPELPKYNGTTDPNEHVTAYTCAVKGNDIKNDNIESILLKKFGETLLKGAMIWYHNLAPNSIDSFAMLADSFIKAHAGAIKVATRKSDVFNIKQKENEMLREFVSHFQMERIDLPPVSDDWAVQAFTQGLNERSSVASKQLKQNLIKYPAVTWSDVHNRYQSKIRAKDDQLGAPSGSVYPNRLLAKESKPNKERKANVMADALSRKAVSMGSIAYIPVGERLLAPDVQALDNQFIWLDVSKPSGVLACMSSRSSLYERIRER